MRVGTGEAGDLTRSRQLEVLLLQEELLLGVEAGELLVAVDSLQVNQSVNYSSSSLYKMSQSAPALLGFNVLSSARPDWR